MPFLRTPGRTQKKHGPACVGPQCGVLRGATLNLFEWQSPGALSNVVANSCSASRLWVGMERLDKARNDCNQFTRLDGFNDVHLESRRQGAQVVLVPPVSR